MFENTVCNGQWETLFNTKVLNFKYNKLNFREKIQKINISRLVLADTTGDTPTSRTVLAYTDNRLYWGYVLPYRAVPLDTDMT